MKVLHQEIKENFSIYNGDSCEMIKAIPTDSVHYSLYSPPFASLFVYSDSDRDIGNCNGHDEFSQHFKFLASELHRVIMPGRLMSVHCMDLPATIGHDGFIGIKDFSGELIRMFCDLGFIYHSRVTIWKDPLVQAVRTKQLSLAHKQISKDSSRCGHGLADYIITFRKVGENPEKIAHGRGFERYYGEMPEPTDRKTDDPRGNKYSHKVWQRYASPVWMDINQTNTLNARQARDNRDERHCCPLQLDTIARCLELWSNEGDIVLSPFAGIGSEGYQAVQMGRKFVGFELKQSYYTEAVRNLNKAEFKKNQAQIEMFG